MVMRLVEWNLRKLDKVANLNEWKEWFDLVLKRSCRLEKVIELLVQILLILTKVFEM